MNQQEITWPAGVILVPFAVNLQSAMSVQHDKSSVGDISIVEPEAKKGSHQIAPRARSLPRPVILGSCTSSPILSAARDVTSSASAARTGDALVEAHQGRGFRREGRRSDRSGNFETS